MPLLAYVLCAFLRVCAAHSRFNISMSIGSSAVHSRCTRDASAGPRRADMHSTSSKTTKARTNKFHSADVRARTHARTHCSDARLLNFSLQSWPHDGEGILRARYAAEHAMRVLNRRALDLCIIGPGFDEDADGNVWRRLYLARIVEVKCYGVAPVCAQTLLIDVEHHGAWEGGLHELCGCLYSGRRR